MKYKGVHVLFSEIAARMSSVSAVEYGGRAIKYHELEEKTNNLANFLIASGASKGSIVAILAEDTIEVITAIIAILKAGCVFVPLDPYLPDRRLSAIVAEVSAKWFVLESRFYGRIPVTLGANVICTDSKRPPDPGRGDLVCLTDYAGYCNLARPDSASDPDDMCYVYFTSGSTGQPKGIAGRLKAIEHFIKWEIKTFGVGEGTRVSQLTTPSFDAYLRDVFVPLCSGGTVCGLKGIRGSLDTESLINWVNQEGINLLHCVPSLLRSMLSNGLKADYFPALKYILLAGEPILPSDVGKWSDIYEDRIQLVNMYGPSETTMTKLYYFIKATDRDRRSIPIGKPMEGAKALIATPEGKPCRQGVVGEIYIHTPFSSLGYYNRPELTSEAFIVNSLTGASHDLTYKTGDLGRVLEDGNLEFLGRKDQQVKIRGIRIELREIESLLLEHVAVKDVAVIDRDDTSGNKYLCAYVAMRKEEKAHELRAYLGERLPDYCVPSLFVEMESLPRTISGKVDRKALPAPEIAEVVEGKRPWTAIEEILAGIWCEVLRRERINVSQSFFELGGHSLLATQVVSRVRDALGVELPLRVLFESPTVEGLAQAVERERQAGRRVEAPPILPAPRDGELPLSFAQQRLWFLQQLEPESAAYNIPYAVRLRGELEVNALEQSLGEVVRRHEVLRTKIVSRTGRPVQVIADAAAVKLPLWDLSEIEEGLQEKLARDIASTGAGQPFDLEQEPVWRAALIRMRKEDHVLLLCLHHVASDGWSNGILEREFSTFYRAYRGGQNSTLPELPVQYADFALWQRQWLQGEALDTQLAYWRRQLEGLPLPDLPTDRPRSPVVSNRGADLTFKLSSELTRELRSLGRREGVTLFMVLLAGFQLALGKYAGQEDVVVGTDVANRNRLETESLIGFFVNQLILRTNLSGNQSLRELLRQVRETTLVAYARQDLPFEKLVEELSPARDESRSPLFQVKIVLQNASLQREGSHLFDIEWFPVNIPVAKFDMLFNLTESSDGLLGYLSYRTDLFTQGSVNWLLSMYKAALQQLGQLESLDMSVKTLMAAIEAPLKSKTQEEQFYLFQSGSRPARRQLPLVSQTS